jgi:hypothetical protein
MSVSASAKGSRTHIMMVGVVKGQYRTKTDQNGSPYLDSVICSCIGSMHSYSN